MKAGNLIYNQIVPQYLFYFSSASAQGFLSEFIDNTDINDI